MNILAIDTSTKKANVCIKRETEIFNKSIDNEITHSEKLLPLIDESLKEANLKLSDMNCLACCIGPGSFTGIRIGIATIKAFAKVLDVPIYAIPSLDVVAYSHIDEESDYVLSIMDAKNSRIYYCLYKVNEYSILEPIVDYSNDVIDAALEKVIAALSNKNHSTLSSITIIGDCANNYKELFEEKLTAIFSNITTYNETISADALIEATQTCVDNDLNSYKKDYLTLDALYVRPSQAERAKNNEL